MERKAQWQTQSDRRLERQRQQEALAKLQVEKEKALSLRRQKLRNKLHAEEEHFFQLLKGQEERPEEKKEKRAAKARQLLELREQEAARLREELLDRQFRDNCDPLRKSLSMKLLQKTVEERNRQVHPCTVIVHILDLPLDRGQTQAAGLGEGGAQGV